MRLEFFGDELEEIREFQVADQRSLATKLEAIDVYPAMRVANNTSRCGQG